MNRTLSKSELSRLVGISRAATGKAAKTHFADAITPNGRIDVDHPVVREWLEARGVNEIPDSAKLTKPVPGKKAAVNTYEKRLDPRRSAGIQTRVGDYDLKDLEDLTIREVVMKYGSVDGFKRFIESLKGIAEYKFRELKVKQQRGELIERDRVASVVFPMIDVAFTRLVSDVPTSLSKLIVARVESGGEGTARDVEELIINANGVVLKNLKKSIKKIGFMKNEN